MIISMTGYDFMSPLGGTRGTQPPAIELPEGNYFAHPADVQQHTPSARVRKSKSKIFNEIPCKSKRHST